MRTKIDIISGFLGAGKTTLIKKLIEEKLYEEKLVIIENEFGQVGIDGFLLKQSGIEIKEINSGCICCALVGDFERSIQEVIEKFQPKRIMIEPSGVGKLSEVIKACEAPKLKDLLQVNMIVTVVDTLKYDLYLANFGEFFENQIKHTATVVLSRTQKAPQEKLESVVSSIQKQNSKANIVTTPWESLKAEQIIAVAERDVGAALESQLKAVKKVVLKRHGHHESCTCGKDHRDHVHTHDAHEGYGCSPGHAHNHDADEVFEVWGVETPKLFDEVWLRNVLNQLSQQKVFGTVLRGKGILQTEKDEWLQFDYVPGEVQINRTGADYTGRICMIGTDLNKQELEKLFQVAV